MPMIAETLNYVNFYREQFGLEVNETWSEMADNVLILRENGVTLEFTAMNGSAQVKQADVVLNTYPLGYTDNYAVENSQNDLDFVSDSIQRTASVTTLITEITVLEQAIT